MSEEGACCKDHLPVMLNNAKLKMKFREKGHETFILLKLFCLQAIFSVAETFCLSKTNSCLCIIFVLVVYTNFKVTNLTMYIVYVLVHRNILMYVILACHLIM